MYEKYLVNDIPKEFLWGGAVTASQTEGGWDCGGKGVCPPDLIPLVKNRKQNNLMTTVDIQSAIEDKKIIILVDMLLIGIMIIKMILNY